MKKMSFVAVLTMMYPMMVVAYTPTITDTNIRNHSYSVEEISASVYNAGMASYEGPLVFSVFEDGATKYYMGIAPDFTQYETISGESIFSLTNTGNDYMYFYELNGNDEFTPIYYYYTNLEGTNNHMDNPSGIINEDFIDNIASLGGALKNTSDGLTINGTFYGNQVYGSGTTVSYDGGAIYNTGTITTINGNFIGNDAQNKGGAIYNNGGIGTINGDFISNASYDYGSDDGGAIYNRNNINSIFGNFTRNHASNKGGAIYNSGTIDTLTGDFMENYVQQHGGAIYNTGTINNLTGDFIENYAHGYGGAIYNGGSIGDLHGNFVGNENGAIYNTGTITSLTGDFIKNSDGLTIYNTGTIGSLNGNFYNNSDSGNQGGAIYNSGTINSLTGDFYNNQASNNSGAIYNTSTGVINFQGNVNFLTYSDKIYNMGTISTIGGSAENPTEINVSSIYNGWQQYGTINLNGYTNMHVANSLATHDLSIGEHSTLYSSAGALNVYGTFVNNGTWVLTSGALNREYTGDGAIAIDGDVTSNRNLSGKNVIINPDKSLTVSFDNIKNANLTNNGMLWFGPAGYSGTLDKALSNYGNVGNKGTLYADTNYIDQDFTNDGMLYLTTAGELSNTINGSGRICIYDDQASADYIISANADNIKNEVFNYNSYGTLNLTGGTVTKPLYGSILINAGDTVTANADYLGSVNCTNEGTLNLTGGTGNWYINSHNGTGNIVIDEGNTVSLNLAHVQSQHLTNNGTLVLVYNYGYNSSLNVAGTGNVVINGNVSVGSAVTQQHITINPDASLTIPLEYLTDINLTNNGMVFLSGSTVLNAPISDYTAEYGNLGNVGTLYTESDYIDQDFINNGTLHITTSGELTHKITGTGGVYIDGTDTIVSANADDIENSVYSAWGTVGTLHLTGGTISAYMSGVLINEGVSVSTDASHIGGRFTNNGTLTLTGGLLYNSISGTGSVLINDGTAVSAYANCIGNNIINNGTLTLTDDGTLSNTVSGDGNIIIDSHITSEVALTQDVTINQYKSLTASVDAVQGINLTNNGTLWFNGGTLNTQWSNYNGTVKNKGTLYTDATYIDQDITNEGNIYLTDGTLSHLISGWGHVYIDENHAISTNADIISASSYNYFTNNGTLTLTGGTLSRMVNGDGTIVIGDNTAVSGNASSFYNNITNDGTLTLADGGLYRSVTGDGNIVINGDVYIGTVVSQPTTINEGKSLTAHIDSVKDADLTNYGTLWFAGGTLDRALTQYAGNVGGFQSRNATAAPEYIDKDIVNDVWLTLTSGTLENKITGSGGVYIGSNNSLYTNMDNIDQTVSLGYSSSELHLTGGEILHPITGYGKLYIDGSDTVVIANAEYIGVNVYRTYSDYGTLNLTGGTLSKQVSGRILINEGDHVTTDLSNISDALITNNGTLTLSSGTLTKFISGNGVIVVNSDVSLSASAWNLGNSVANDGILTLTGGTLSNPVTGDGSIIIDGAVASDVNLVQSVTINSGKSLTVSVDNIKNTDLTNNGTLWLSGGTLDKAISNYGNANISGELYTSAEYLDRDVINSGTLHIDTDNTLSHIISGSGTIAIDEGESLFANAGYIGNNVTNDGILTLTGGTLAKSVTGDGHIVIDGNVVSNVNVAQATTINENQSLTVSVNNIKNTNLTNNGTLWFNTGTLDKNISNYGNAGVSGNLTTYLGYIDQDIVNNGTLTLNGSGTLTHSIAGNGSTIINANISNAGVDVEQNITISSGCTFTTPANNIVSDSLTNYGTLTLTGGTLDTVVTGSSGRIVISGDVISNVNIAENTTINSGKSLTISFDNIKNTNLTNYGTLWLNGGTLDRNISNYTNAQISGDLYANANYINRVVTNNGTLYLTGGTLSRSITGTGEVVINGVVTSSVEISQPVTINQNKFLTTSANYISTDSFTNNGTLVLTAGALSNTITGSGNIRIDSGKTVSSNADYLDNSVVNNGTLNLTGGTLLKSVTGTGTTTIAAGNTVSADASCIDAVFTNNGTLNLIGGTLSRSISGSGNIVIDGDVISDVNMVRTHINTEKSLRISADNITANTLTNDGSLILTGGTLSKSVSGNGQIVIDGDVSSGTYTSISQEIIINPEKSLTAYYANYIDNDVTNNGTLNLTSGTLYHPVTGSGDIVIGNAASMSANADYIGNPITNNGTVTLTGGTLSQTISGSGNIVINGAVATDVNMTQNTTIYSGKSLTVSVDNIKNVENLTNYGILWFNAGVLNRNVSYYANLGSVGNIGDLQANANYIDRVLTNNGTLSLTGGTLRQLVTGSGDIIIDGDVISDVDLTQDTTINMGKSLTTSFARVAAANITNNGMLWFNDGTLTKNISSYGNTGNVGVLSTNANYLDADFENNNMLYIMGGILTHAVTGSGHIIVDNNLRSDANYIGNDVTNNGTLTLTGGTLTSSVTGPGTTYIDGDVVADVNISQNTTINSGKTLTISAEHVNANSFINNGNLYLTSGTVNNTINGSGHTIITSEIINNAQNNNVIDITNTGYLTTNGNNLLNTVNINNNGVLNITNGTLTQDINGGNTIVGNNAIISSKTVANIDMNGTWNVDSNVVSATTANINGIVNLNIDRVYKDSNTYVGGKLIADNINLGDASELRLVVAENDLVKGDSTGYLQLVQSETWTGNWRNILQNNAKYTMDIDEINHAIKFTYFRTGQEIIQEQSNSQNIYVVFVAWDQESFSDNPVVQQIIDKLNYASQYNTAEYVDMLNSIAPTDSNVISGTSSTLNTAINNQVSDRLTFIGRNGGDTFDGVGVWGQGLYNHSSQSGNSTFAGDTLGFSLGVDKKISDNSVLGLGYTLSQTSATSGTRKIDATGNTVFAYGEYRPHRTRFDKTGNIKSRTVSPLYVNTVLSYGVTSYSENAGYGISSEYSTNTLGINGNVGYDVTDSIDIFVGARYLQISQNEYTDNIGQTISTQDNSIITARFGGKYIGTNMKFAPTAHLELSYDITSNDRLAVVNTGHTSYNISGETINPFGVQTGIGFISNINNWNLSLNYDLEWRSDFISHTGRIKAKYVF